MKSEDACCLAQKHSQMNLVRGNVALHDHSSQYLGQFLFYELLKTRAGEYSFNNLIFKMEWMDGSDGRIPNHLKWALF